MKRAIYRFINSFCYAVSITMLIQLAVMLSSGELLMLPEFVSRFPDSVTAFASQLVLIGIMSGITGAGTVIFESKRLGLLAQSIGFLIIMLAAWIPVACIVWGFHRYKGSMITTILSIIVSYGICWWIQYVLCKREIEAINAKLQEKKGE